MNTTISMSTRPDKRGRFKWHIQTDAGDDIAGSATSYEEQMQQVKATLLKMAEAKNPLRIADRPPIGGLSANE